MNIIQQPSDTKSKIVIIISLFVLALLPRIFGLGIFITSDEPLWFTRSIFFAEALINGNLQDTLQTGHPGVTTMWSGVTGLYLAYLLQQPADSFAVFLQSLSHNADRIDVIFLPWARLPIVILAAACVAMLYWLGAKLLGYPIAIIAALMLAFDPLFLAHSRTLHHDALAAIFMSLSVLALLNFSTHQKYGYLVLSAILAGFGLLSKGTGLILFGFSGLFFAWLWLYKKRSFSSILVAGLVWFGLTAATFTLFWPAMWITPVAVLQTVFGWVISSTDVEAVAETTSLNWSGKVPELGVAFYPVNWLLKSTLLSLVGLIVLPGWWRNKNSYGQHWVVIWLAIFSLLFFLALTIGDKRDGRYLLPIYPGLWLLTACGLYWLAERLIRKFQHIGNTAKVILAAVFGVILLLFSLPWYPYYHTYYNPLIGGSWLAPKLIKVGWGEGMEQVAAYLNQLPNADKLVVATSYEQNFLPFFKGNTVAHHDSVHSNYVLNYVRQIQNGYPYPEYWQYYQAREPEYALELGNIDYVWLYHQGSLVRVRNTTFGDNLEVMGYTFDKPLLSPGQTATVTLVWRTSENLSNTAIAHIELVDDNGNIWGQAKPAPVIDPAGPSAVEGHYQLEVSPNAPRFDGELQVTLQQNGQLLGQAAFGSIPVRQTSIPQDVTPLTDGNFNHQIQLLGYQISPGSPGQPMGVTLYWRLQQPVDFNYTVFVQLVDSNNGIHAQHDSEPVNGQLPTNQWTTGEVVADTHSLTISPDAQPGDYTLLVGLYRWDTGERLPIINDTSGQNAVTIPGIPVQ